MSIEELKDLLFKVSQGRRDAAEHLAELLHPILEKPKKASK